jgi:hypothetical protein
MEIGHLPAMMLFSLLVSVVLSVIAKDTLRERLRYGVKSFALFMGVALALGWLMYFVPWR